MYKYLEKEVESLNYLDEGKKCRLYLVVNSVQSELSQEPLKLWTELYSELSHNGGLELVFLLKSSRNKKDLNDVTAAQFLVFFCCWQLRKRHRKPGSCDVIKVLLNL